MKRYIITSIVAYASINYYLIKNDYYKNLDKFYSNCCIPT